MLYYQTTYPEKMTGAHLDRGLAHGWYRIAQSFMTTDFIAYAEQLLPVFWLRIDLNRYRPSRSARRILAKNAGRSVTIKPAEITDEIEQLFAQYRSSIDFSISDSVREYLLGDGESNAYETWLIEVRDGSRLIAVGYFDTGAQTSTGILHFFDPHYGDASLGKFLFLLELDYAMQEKFAYYYMGYICKGNSKFDYKLFADRRSTEVFTRRTNRWKPYSEREPHIDRWAPRMIAAANKLYRLVPAAE